MIVYIYIGYRLGIGMGTYSDQMTGVVHGGFLLQLLHDGGLDFIDVAGRAGGGAGTEDGHCDVLIKGGYGIESGSNSNSTE